MVQGVTIKRYSDYSLDEIKELYKETFNMAPCSKGCSGTYWKGAYDAIVRFYNEQNKLPMSQAKYIWNPKYKGITAVYKGYGVTSDCDKQHILEALYNEPKRAGLILLNPNYKEEVPVKKETVKLSPEEQKEKDLVLDLYNRQGYSKNKIKTETGLQAKTINQYLE